MRVAGSTPQPFQSAALHPLRCTHLCPSDKIQSGAYADKRYIGQNALAMVGEQLLFRCAQGDEAEIGP